MAVLFLSLLSCSEGEKTMVMIDPGHYHAALIQKNHLPGVSDIVRVYAPECMELDSYLSTVRSFNQREDDATGWREELHISDCFLDSLPPASKGDFVVLAGKNRNKATYIKRAIECGYSVLSDKPMAITGEGYESLVSAYELAKKKGLVICDLMTERHDVLNAIVRDIVSDRESFGDITGVSISSVHHFFKNVNGASLRRPMWYYDVRQQGEGIADVTTHLIDLIFWQCMPDVAVTPSDITELEACHYPTSVSLEQYERSTGAQAFPDYLSADVCPDGILNVMSNGRIGFRLKSIPVSVSVRWDYEPVEGGGDTSESLYDGTKASVRMVQNVGTNFDRQLLLNVSSSSEGSLLEKLKNSYPDMICTRLGDGRWLLDMPQDKKPGHEAHFNMVAASFLEMIDRHAVPLWEKTNTLTKYYITTRAVQLSSLNED